MPLRLVRQVALSIAKNSVLLCAIFNATCLAPIFAALQGALDGAMARGTRNGVGKQVHEKFHRVTLQDL